MKLAIFVCPFQKQTITEYMTIVNGKWYAIMIYSDSNDPIETNPVIKRIVSSFDIFPIKTTNDFSNAYLNNDDINQNFSLYENSNIWN